MNSYIINDEFKVHDTKNGISLVKYIGNNDIVVIPNNITSINSGAFVKKNEIKELVLGDNVKSISTEGLLGLDKLIKVKVSRKNKYFLSKYNSIINKKTNTLILAVKKVPSGVEVLNTCCFANSNVRKIVIPDSVRIIKEYAIFLCPNLKSIEVGKNVSIIEEDAVSLCRNLNKIKIDIENDTFDSRNDCNAIIESNSNVLILGSNKTKIEDSIVRIENNAFEFVSKIHELVVPKSVLSIGDNAFYYSSINSIKYLGTIEEFNNVSLGASIMDEDMTLNIKCSDGDINLRLDN